MEQKGKNCYLEESEELCCADKNFCSMDCAPKENSKSRCGCGGRC